jgi:hypothetical protein
MIPLLVNTGLGGIIPFGGMRLLSQSVSLKTIVAENKSVKKVVPTMSSDGCGE